MIKNNAYYELFASNIMPNPDQVGYWVDLGANSKGKVIKLYNRDTKKWVNLTFPNDEDAVAPSIGSNGNWFVDNRDTGVPATGQPPKLDENNHWLVWDINKKKYVDSGVYAKGEPGKTPIIKNGNWWIWDEGKGDYSDTGISTSKHEVETNTTGDVPTDDNIDIYVDISDNTVDQLVVPEAANDGRLYGRQNNSWMPIESYDDTELRTSITDLENNKLDKGDTYTKDEINSKISSVYRSKGSVSSYENLPKTGNEVGDVYNVIDTGDNYAWLGQGLGEKGDGWDKLSGMINLTEYAKTQDIDRDFVKKEPGKALMSVGEMTRLSDVHNYDDTNVKADIKLLQDTKLNRNELVDNYVTKEESATAISEVKQLAEDVVIINNNGIKPLSLTTDLYVDLSNNDVDNTVVGEALNDGKYYARKNKSWVDITDEILYVRSIMNKNN